MSVGFGVEVGIWVEVEVEVETGFSLKSARARSSYIQQAHTVPFVL